MGVAQSLYFTLSIAPIFSKRIKSFSITGRKAYGADLALQNLGTASGLTNGRTCMFFIVPSSSLNITLCFCSNVSMAVVMYLISFQSSWSSWSQFLPELDHHLPLVDRVLQFLGNFNLCLSNTFNCSPGYVLSTTADGCNSRCGNLCYNVFSDIMVRDAPVSSSMTTSTLFTFSSTLILG